MSSTPTLLLLRSQRVYITLPPLSYSLLQSVIRDHKLAPITSIIYNRCIISVEEVRRGGGIRFEDGANLNRGKNAEAVIKIGGHYPHPDFKTEFNSALLKSFRKLAALQSYTDEKIYPQGLTEFKTLPGKLAHSQKEGPFNPSICVGTIACSEVNPLDNLDTQQVPGLTSVKLTDNTKMVAGGCSDGVIRVFDMGGKHAKKDYVGHKGPVYDVDWAKDGRTLLSCGMDGRVRLWNAGHGNVNTCVSEFRGTMNDRPVYR